MRELNVVEFSDIVGGTDECTVIQPVYVYGRREDGPFDGGTSGSGGTIQTGTDPAGNYCAK